MQKVILSLLIIFVGCYNSGYAQLVEEEISFFEKEPTSLPKNTIHGSAGYVLLGAGVNVNYERTFYQRNKKNFNTFNFRVGVGRWLFWDVDGSLLVLGVNNITSRGNHHIELMLGSAVFYNIYNVAPLEINYNFITPVISAGYRYQKPDGWFVFRCGLGSPEGIYLGIGASF